jgi:hypothetical protein
VSKTYTCAACGESCLSSWSEEEAQAEYEQTFPTYPERGKASVCDDCYPLLLAAARKAGLIP